MVISAPWSLTDRAGSSVGMSGSHRGGGSLPVLQFAWLMVEKPVTRVMVKISAGVRS